jgi:mannose-1-phosphate guanylyltransferase
LYDLIESDPEGNIIEAVETLLVDTKKTLVYQDQRSSPPRLIAALGVEDLIVVDTEDVLLVCRQDQAERVRDLVKLLETRGKEEYL